MTTTTEAGGFEMTSPRSEEKEIQVTEIDAFIFAIGDELPLGPTEDHIGHLVALVRAEAVVFAVVESVSPFGGDGYVKLSDGTNRSVGVGKWYPATLV